MKNTFLFSLLIFQLISCTFDRLSDNSESTIIGLKQTKVEIFENSAEFTFTTKIDFWWLNEILINGNPLDISLYDKLNKNLVIKENGFQFKRTPNEIFIILENNPNEPIKKYVFLIRADNETTTIQLNSKSLPL